MAIDTKNIQYFVWKIVKFSMNSCCRFVQKHPFVSGTVSLFFLLYLFLPSVFFFLIYSSPVIVCIYVFLRYYVEPKQPEIKKDKRVDEKSSVESKSLPADAAVVVSRNDSKPVMHDDQISRRKNVIKELEAEGNNKETGVILATTPADASIIGSQNVFTEEKGSASVDHGESSSWNVSGAHNVQPLDQRVSVPESEPSMDDPIVQKVSAEHSEKGNVAAGGDEEEESSDEEEMQRDGNNAVEWTADDQQNLMDLGDSELERNKRLESLIARRRARKLFKMAVEKRVTESGSGGQMPPLSIVRNTILNNIPNNQDFVEDIQVPGSAPSVLLPARNPFDIPYEPYEERPNLTGDSFHEEFSIHQRELLFCRHESFFLGPSFSVESQQDQHESHVGPYGIDKRTALGPRLSRYRTVSDMSAHDQLIEDLLASQEGEALSRNISATDLVEPGSHSPKETKNSEEPKLGMAGMKREAVENSADRSEFQMETDSTRDNSSEPCSLASNEASEMSFHTNTSSNTGNLEPKVDKPRQSLSDRVKSSLTFTIPEGIALNGPSYDSSPSAFDKPRMDDRLFYRYKGPCHSPGYSIASDLQVEVSELGSPPLPLDGTMSPADAESSYDGDIEKDVTSGSEEMWGASCHLAGVDENESRSREVNEVSVDDILGAGLSAMKQNLQNQIASSSLPEQIAEQDNSSTSSLSSSRTEMQDEDHSNKEMQDEDHSNKVSENVKQYLEEVPKPSISSIGLPPQIPQKASSAVKESLSHPPSEASSKELEVLSTLPADKSGEVNASLEVKDEAVHASNEKENLELSEENLKLPEEMDSGSEISTNKEAIMDLSQPAKNITSESSNDIVQNLDKPAKQQTVIEPKADPSKLNEHGEAGSSSMKTEVQAEQNTTEVGVSGVDQSSDNGIMSPTLPQILEGDQISTVSSSCSSPRSVLPGKNRRSSSASFDQQIPIQNDESQSIDDDIARNNSLSHTARNNSLSHMSAVSTDQESPPKNSQHLATAPMDLPSSSSDVRILEEPSAEVVECTSEPVINPQASPILLECINGSPSKTVEIAFEPNAPRSMVKEEETSNSPAQSTREADLTSSKNYSVENEKEDKGKSVVGCECESNNAVENEAAIEPSVPPAAENAVEKEPSDPLSQKPEVEAAVVHDMNETVADDTSNEKSLIHQENVSDQLKTIEDYKHEPDDTKVVVEPLTSIKPEVKEAPKYETNTAE